MEKNNRLIAEFMGYTLNENDEYPIEYITVQGHWDNCSIQDLNYHKSWDWLMKVVEKIEKEFCSTNIHYYSQKQMYSVEFLGFNIEYDNSEYGDDKMKILYNSCVKFINFYNKQKEE